jgi:hypothetical protein
MGKCLCIALPCVQVTSTNICIPTQKHQLQGFVLCISCSSGMSCSSEHLADYVRCSHPGKLPLLRHLPSLFSSSAVKKTESCFALHASYRSAARLNDNLELINLIWSPGPHLGTPAAPVSNTVRPLRLLGLFSGAGEEVPGC